MVRISILFATATAYRVGVQRHESSQPNPPVWPETVKVFGPETAVSEIQGAVDAAFATNGGHEPADHGHWSDLRYAFLFKPGRYNVEVPVGYYTQVLGLGASPTDVVFTSAKGVYCDEGTYDVGVGGLNTFWRSVENFQTDANYDWIPGRGGGMTWAASQAAPMRRLEVSNNLLLYRFREGNWAGDYVSGGFLGATKVHGVVASGSQQQFYTRNSDLGGWQDGNWNMVFMGVNGAPASHCGADPSMCSSAIITLDQTPVIAEKPFISIEHSGKYTLNVPQVKRNSRGVDISRGTQIPFDRVYVARDSKDSAQSINSQLEAGFNVVLSPGNYRLTEPIVINKPNTVLLGLGLATLISSNGNACIEVGNVAGVRIGGILVSAGSLPTETLIKIGSSKWAGDANNPVMLQDVFIRVGDHTNKGVQARVMLTINTGYTIGDNCWLWRADHTEQGLVRNGDNPCEVGLIVNADDVSMLGWSAEHTLHDQVQWNGERGASYFLQVELAYDVDQSFVDAGHTGYRVAPHVQSHVAYGIGIYHYMRDHEITVRTGVVAPPHLEGSFHQPFGVFLNGSGVMNHLINDKGQQTAVNPLEPTKANPKWWCSSSSSFLDFSSSVEATCSVGDPTVCPNAGGVGCAGNSCCPDGSTCPSAHPDFACCPAPKKADCTGGVVPPPAPPGPPGPPPAPQPAPPAPKPVPGSGTCTVGSLTTCADGTNCMGNQCCPDQSVCPSASPDFASCPVPAKKLNCL